jgi:hypothetical protein
MPDPQAFPFCSEFYAIENSVEVVVSMKGTDRRVRIDVLHDLKQGGYRASVYMLRDVTWKVPQPAPLATAQIWTAWIDFPSVQGKTAEEALSRALSFLGERCGRDEGRNASRIERHQAELVSTPRVFQSAP